jgi:hypothetical protein
MTGDGRFRVSAPRRERQEREGLERPEVQVVCLDGF